MLALYVSATLYLICFNISLCLNFQQRSAEGLVMFKHKNTRLRLGKDHVLPGFAATNTTGRSPDVFVAAKYPLLMPQRWPLNKRSWFVGWFKWF